MRQYLGRPSLLYTFYIKKIKSTTTEQKGTYSYLCEHLDKILGKYRQLKININGYQILYGDIKNADVDSKKLYILFQVNEVSKVKGSP